MQCAKWNRAMILTCDEKRGMGMCRRAAVYPPSESSKLPTTTTSLSQYCPLIQVILRPKPIFPTTRSAPSGVPMPGVRPCRIFLQVKLLADPVKPLSSTCGDTFKIVKTGKNLMDTFHVREKYLENS